MNNETNDTKDINRRRSLAIASLMGTGIVFLTNPLTQAIYRGVHDSSASIAMRGFLAPVHMALLVGSAFGITELLRKKADRAGLIGGTLTVMGWAVGIRILGFGQLESLVKNGVPGLPADTMFRIYGASPIVWASLVPIGLLFPIGLLTLGVTLLARGPAPRWIGALLAAGGVLFPMGRIPNAGWALLAADLVLGAAFTLLGWQLLRQGARTSSPAKLTGVAATGTV